MKSKWEILGIANCGNCNKGYKQFWTNLDLIFKILLILLDWRIGTEVTGYFDKWDELKERINTIKKGIKTKAKDINKEIKNNGIKKAETLIESRSNGEEWEETAELTNEIANKKKTNRGVW